MTTIESSSHRVKLHIAWIFAVLSWIWLVIFLHDLTNVGVGFLASWVLLHTFPIFGILWLLATGSLLWEIRLPPRSAACWWLAASSALTLAVILAATDVGLIARVRLSEPWLEEHVSEARQGVVFSGEPRMVGLLHVEEIYEHHGVVYFITGEYGFLDRAGIAFVPDGCEPQARHHIMRHLFGNWYTCMWRF